MIHHRFVTFAVAYMNLPPFFLLSVLGWHVRFYSNFITSHAKRFWQDLTRWTFTWVSFIAVIAFAIIVDSFHYLYKSIIRSSMKCCYVWSGAPNWNLYILDKLWDCYSYTRCILSLLKPWLIFEMCSLLFWLPVNVNANFVSK